MFVYALASQSKDRIYVGMTTDLTRRLKEHNSGYNISTAPYRPFDVLYCEECESRQIARLREKYWKSGIGKQKLKCLWREGLSTDR